MSSVAVIGLGTMGSRIAERLIRQGHQVGVWNRSTEKSESLVRLGAQVHETPADAAHAAEAVITMVSDPVALQEVSEGPSGLGRGVIDSKTLIEMSTVGPDTIARLSEVVGDERLIDAPVFGSISEAEAGELNIFVGGSAALFERWSPLLADLGAPIHVGPLGSGAAAKLTANLALFGTLGVLGEALALAEALGLRREVAFDVLRVTPLSTQAKRRRSAIEKRAFPKRFKLSLAAKDAKLITAAGSAARHHLRVAPQLHGWFAEADEAGWGDLDYSAILAWIIGGPRPDEEIPGTAM